MMLKNFLLFQNFICFDIKVVNIEQTCICICFIYIHTQKSSSGWGLSRGYGYKVNKVIQNKLIFVGVFSQSKCLLQIKLNYQLFYRWSLNYHLYYQGENIMTFVHCVLWCFIMNIILNWFTGVNVHAPKMSLICPFCWLEII